MKHVKKISLAFLVLCFVLFPAFSFVGATEYSISPEDNYIPYKPAINPSVRIEPVNEPSPREYVKANKNNFFVFRRGNGVGEVKGYINDKEVFSCGDNCEATFPEGTVLRLQASPREDSNFNGWSDTCDNASCVSSAFTEFFDVVVSNQNKTIVYTRFDLEKLPENPSVLEEDRQVPRVMFWFGKVNQHWDKQEEIWKTDSDGVSGARENKLEYCKKFYPATEKVVEYKKETTNTWKDAGNRGEYVSTKLSYRCVQPGESISGADASNAITKPNKGSVCYYFPNLPLCVPLDHPDAIRHPFQKRLDDFVAKGEDDNTEKLGEGERAAVLKSYKEAFDKIPENEEEMSEVVKIANGHFPSKTSKKAETKAKQEFVKIYKRVPEISVNEKDKAAINILAYGLRQKAQNRNLNSERQGISIFTSIYEKSPENTSEWNALQTITYSGAIRELDSDGDLLPDRRERELGTDVYNKDTDGDGYMDGEEVLHGFDPLTKANNSIKI